MGKDINKIKQLFKKVVEISTQMGCANNCTYCPQELFLNSYFKAYKKTTRKMSLEDFKRYLSKIPKHITITFSGMTEPFLNPEALDMVEYAVNEKYNVSVNTTLRNLSKQDIDRLLKLNIIYYSIHTPDKDENICLKADEKYLENLEYFYKNCDKNISSFLVIGNPDENVKNILKDDLENLSICTRADNLSSNIKGSAVEFKQENSYDRNTPVICGCKLNDGDSDDPFKIEKSILLPDGSMILCCNDYAMKHILGNLNDSSYEEIMNGEEMQRIISSMQCIDSDYPILCRNCDKGTIYDPIKWKNFKKYGRYEILEKKSSIFDKLFSFEKDEDRKVLRLLGLKFSFKIKKDNKAIIINQNNDELYEKIKFLNVVKNQHQKTFSSFKNIHQGKDIVICATGPSFKDYNPIENAIHIGVNGALFKDNIKLDYLFVNDYDFMRMHKEEYCKHINDDCKKFYAILKTEHIRIPEYVAQEANAYRYYTNHPETTFNYELDVLPIGDFGSVAFAAAQFALWSHPKKIYLVGCDCSCGYYNNQKRTFDFYKTYYAWKKFKEFAKINYPDVEIISINPVGLRGMFKDVYTN